MPPANRGQDVPLQRVHPISQSFRPPYPSSFSPSRALRTATRDRFCASISTHSRHSACGPNFATLLYSHPPLINERDLSCLSLTGGRDRSTPLFPPFNSCNSHVLLVKQPFPYLSSTFRSRENSNYKFTQLGRPLLGVFPPEAQMRALADPSMKAASP